MTQPTEEGFYWATAAYHKGHERRRVVLVLEWNPGRFIVMEPGEERERKLSEFCDWSARVIDPVDNRNDNALQAYIVRE